MFSLSDMHVNSTWKLNHHANTGHLSRRVLAMTQSVGQIMNDKKEHNYVADAQNWEQRVRGELDAVKVCHHYDIRMLKR